jgi:hypothetical protein
VDVPMRSVAKSNELFFRIFSKTTARLLMMDLQIPGTSASLTSPAVALKHLPAKLLIRISVQAKPALSGDARSHDVCGIRSKNSCR